MIIQEKKPKWSRNWKCCNWRDKNFAGEWMDEETKGRAILLKSQIPKAVRFLETENAVAHIRDQREEDRMHCSVGVQF